MKQRARETFRHGLLAVSLAFVVGLATPAAAQAAELLMFRRAGCPWCHTWDRTVGPVYPQTDIGRDLPVVMIDMDRDEAPEVKLDRPVRYSPTFVVVDDGIEIGRIEGYPGEDFFWGLLGRLHEKVKAQGS
jgi:glutaredoxin